MARQANPADATNLPAVTEQTRRPMGGATQSLAVPEIPGYEQYWFRGEPQRLSSALAAGYEFVDPSETTVNNFMLGSDMSTDGNTDMGSRVSRSAGADFGTDGQPLRLYLMKIKTEWAKADREAQVADGSRLDNVRRSLAGGLIGSEGQSGAERAMTYMDQKRTKLPSFLTKRNT